MSDPTAQGKPAGAENQPNVEAPKPAAPSPNEGFQKRIDELTAKLRESERTAQSYQAQVEVLTQPQPAPKPQVSVDPAIAEQIQAVMGPLMQELQFRTQQLQQTMGVQQLQQSAAQLKVPEKVAQRAQEIMLEYAKRGQQVNPETARRYALGEAWEQEQAAKLKAEMERGQFNGHGAPFTASGAPASLSAGPAKPSNFDNLPLDKQLQWYESNVGDKPL